MIYIYAIVAILVFLLLIDVLGLFFRLGVSGITSLFHLVFYDIGYRKRTDSIKKIGNKKVILIAGDSIAVGPGALPEETIAGRLAVAFKADVINVAVNGARTRDIVDQIDSVEGKKFDLTIVHAGNNDIWRLTNLAKLEKDIALLLDRARTTSDKVILFRGGNIGSCPFFPLIVGWIYSRRSKQVRDIFMRIAEERSVFYVEKFMSRKDDIFLKDPHYFYCWDMLHLNGNGYKVWFEYLIEEMKRYTIYPI